MIIYVANLLSLGKVEKDRPRFRAVEAANGRTTGVNLYVAVDIMALDVLREVSSRETDGNVIECVDKR